MGPEVTRTSRVGPRECEGNPYHLAIVIVANWESRGNASALPVSLPAGTWFALMGFGASTVRNKLVARFSELVALKSDARCQGEIRWSSRT